MKKDLYKILGIDKNSSSIEIKMAYRDLSKKHHPDKGGEASKFAEISEAYSVLNDPARRERYDDTGEISREQSIHEQIVSFYSTELLPVIINRSTVNIDMIDLLIDQVDNYINRVTDLIKKKKIAIEKLHNAANRFKRSDDKENAFKSMLQATAEKASFEIGKAESEILFLNQVKEDLQQYSYEHSSKTQVTFSSLPFVDATV
jgi:curved DNA-binding protein CbpA